MSRAVFIDRDGVINRAVVKNGKPYPPPSLEDLELLPGVPEALTSLRQAGYRTIIVTNQPDVATGKQSQCVVEKIHAHLRDTLALDDILVCYHTDDHQCDCRKPQPGMLVSAATQWSIELHKSYLVGDRWRDIEAGERAGCQTFFVEGDEPYQEKRPANPNWVVGSLLEASNIICLQDKRGEET